MRGTIYRHGQFVWRDLLTVDTGESRRFYAEVFGYELESVKSPDGGDYTMLMLGRRPVGGVMKNPAPQSTPYWSVWVSVTDVDAAARRAAQSGGEVVSGPTDMGGFGRCAVLRDPTGGTISAWKAASGDGERAKDRRPEVGAFCWEQLNASDPTALGAFYETTFSWTRASAPGGAGMSIFTSGDVEVASLMKAPPGASTHWLTYVAVDTLADARRRVEAHGGKTLVERIDVPTVGAIAVVSDNVGAALGLFEAPAI